MMRILDDKEGFTLVELMMVLAIIMILLGIAVLAFSTWSARYNIEAEIQQIYGDLAITRTRAMHRNRMHFVQLTAANYTVYEDTNPAPLGDGALTVGLDAVFMQRIVSHPISMSLGLGGGLNFDTRGFAANFGPGQTEAICVLSTVSPDYDCIVLSQARINMGKIVAQGGGCVAANCQLK